MRARRHLTAFNNVEMGDSLNLFTLLFSHNYNVKIYTVQWGTFVTARSIGRTYVGR